MVIALIGAAVYFAVTLFGVYGHSAYMAGYCYDIPTAPACQDTPRPIEVPEGY